MIQFLQRLGNVIVALVFIVIVASVVLTVTGHASPELAQATRELFHEGCR